MAKYTKKELEKAVKESLCKRQVLNKLGLSSKGSGGYRQLEKTIQKWNIDISHFDPYAAAQKTKLQNGTTNQKYSTQELLTIWSTFKIGSSRLKHRLYREGILERVCVLCGQDENWNGKKMSLRLDHINGIQLDNRIENLRIVCPNCDATLDTYCGKNIAFQRSLEPQQNFGFDCKPEERVSLCLTCDKPVISNSKRKFCDDCLSLNRSEKASNMERKRKVARPDYNVIKQEIQNYGYSSVALKYGVSDNAVRKWMRAYHKELNITDPLPKFDYKISLKDRKVWQHKNCK